jgi:RNA polymerase sigma-70 factor (ECF subfamily)
VNGRDEFEDTYRAAFPAIVRSVRPLVDSTDEAVDVVQEAFARAYLRWASSADLDCLEAWVRTVAVNLALSRVRRLRTALRHVASQRTADFDLGEDPTTPVADRIDLVRALRRLPAKQREIVFLHYLSDTSVKDIATQLGISESSVKTTLHRSRSRLHECLGGTPR